MPATTNTADAYKATGNATPEPKRPHRFVDIYDKSFGHTWGRCERCGGNFILDGPVDELGHPTEAGSCPGTESEQR